MANIEWEILLEEIRRTQGCDNPDLMDNLKTLLISLTSDLGPISKSFDRSVTLPDFANGWGGNSGDRGDIFPSLPVDEEYQSQFAVVPGVLDQISMIQEICSRESIETLETLRQYLLNSLMNLSNGVSPSGDESFPPPSMPDPNKI